MFSAAFLPVISAATVADSQTGMKELTPTEQWVVAQNAAGNAADLTRQFPADQDRKLSAHFLRDLLTGELPGFKPHRNGLRIIGAIIDEPIDLQNAQIPCTVSLTLCHFRKDVFFAHAKVVGHAVFDSTHFEGKASFTRADIAGNFTAFGARFRNRQTKVIYHGEPDFQNIKVEGDAVFDRATFERQASFARADVAGDFTAFKASFLNQHEAANFFSMKVGGRGIFRGALFEGMAEFAEAAIASDFDAMEAKFQGAAIFLKLKVGGRAFFSDTRFRGLVDFAYADIGWLDLSRASWPKLAAQIQMQGMNYNYIRAVQDNEAKSHEALLELAKQWPYTPDVYANLEAFFLRRGYPADADKAFIAGKRREQEQWGRKPKERVLEYIRSGQWFQWLGSWGLDLLVGYGRHPWQAGIPCAVLVALGCILFSPQKMEPQKPQDTPRVYNRFWYSLGLFLPVVDLQADTVWKPKADQPFLRNYARVHALLGWVLIPIVLAALTGLIK